MELSRPKVLWSAPALGITTEIPLDANGTVFLLEADRHAPFAANARTGRRLWTAEADPAMPVAPLSPYSTRDFQLSLADGALVLATQGYLGAYDTGTGKRLWSRPVIGCTLLEHAPIS